jgi:hypothetical protein
MVNDQIVETAFADARVPCTHDGRTVQVAVGPLCRAIGLDEAQEVGRLGRDEDLMPLLGDIRADNTSVAVASLPVAALVFWFERLKDTHDDTALRRRLAILQQEGFGMLLEQWLQLADAQSTPDDAAKLGRDFTRLQRQIVLLADSLKNAGTPLEREILRAQLNQLCNFQIGPYIRQSLVLDRFWETLFSHLETHRDVNHARRADRFLALNFRHLATTIPEARDTIKLTPELSNELKKSRNPSFLGVRVVNSRVWRKSLRCWVFSLV